MTETLPEEPTPVDPMIARIEDIGKLADTILKEIKDIYAQYKVALPPRQYVSVGGPNSTAHDDEQVTVTLTSVSPGIAGGPASPYSYLNDVLHANFHIEIVRAIPVPNERMLTPAPPTPEAITLSSKALMKDAILLIEAGKRVGEETYSETAMLETVSGQPQGGMQAMTMSLTLVV